MKKNFKIIEGGIPTWKNCKKSFRNAYITKSRMKGRACLHIHWILPDFPEYQDLHQFFLLDLANHRLLEYESVRGNILGALRDCQNNFLKPLVSDTLPLNLSQAAHLIKGYISLQHVREYFPKGHRDEFSFILSAGTPLTTEESANLDLSLFEEIVNDYHLIHSFLIAYFSHDLEVARHLSTAKIQDIPNQDARILLKNSVTKGDGDFLCNCLTSNDKINTNFLIGIGIDEMKISKFSIHSAMNISPMEAEMVTFQPEYVTHYQFPSLDQEDYQPPVEIEYHSTIEEYGNGRLLAMYGSENDYLHQPVYSSRNEVDGYYFITDGADMLLISYSQSNIETLENRIERNISDYPMQLICRYEFQQPIMSRFIGSSFFDFDAFLRYLRDE